MKSWDNTIPFIKYIIYAQNIAKPEHQLKLRKKKPISKQVFIQSVKNIKIFYQYSQSIIIKH